MKERPIIFNTEMVRAIFDGRKTQTRRVIKPQPKHYEVNGYPTVGDGYGGVTRQGASTDKLLSEMSAWCPYGQPDDMLWVRETWAHSPYIKDKIIYKADGAEYNALKPKWKPSIHMPKSASRLWLEITDIRVERVQDISDEDVLREGFRMNSIAIVKLGYKGAFRFLWDSINAKRGYSWESNPWVWVVEFKKIDHK